MTRQELDDAVMAMIATNDVHLFRAALENGVHPAEVTPEQRQEAKNNNFRLLYSGGTQRFARPEIDKTMIDRALGHAPDPDYFKARYNIPDGVYYFDGNFYDATTKAGMGIEFYNAWHFRAREFPGRPLEHIKIRAEIGRRDDH